MPYITLILFILVFLAIPYRANAYIDLGLTGSLFQLMYLIFFAVLAFVAAPFLFFWKRIRRWVKARFQK